MNKKKKWFEAKNNTFVYAQGLPLDVTEDEVVEFFMKCGVLKIDPTTGKKKVKIYTDESGKQKGDARICYENIESVEMALEWLCDSEIRPGYKVHVEQAVFEQHGETYKPREVHKLDKIEKLRIKAEHERQMAWDEEELHEVGLKIVILEGFYTLDEIEEITSQFPEEDLEGVMLAKQQFFKELESELRAEIESKIGPVHKIDFFPDNPAGVCKIKFMSGLHAE